MSIDLANGHAGWCPVWLRYHDVMALTMAISEMAVAIT